MKLLVIGLGQCGGRIADRFARLNKRARALRKINILADTFAVNTDVADLSGLRTIKSDYKHRILIGGQRTNGHGVGKVSELGAEVAREDTDKIIDAIRTSEQFYETDAFLLVAAAAGGTGSGSIAVLTQYLKERYIGKPVYNVIILPFRQEETTESRAVYNTAMCLKSTYLVADAIILIDNQRYVKKDSPAEKNLAVINARVVEPFYNLLCAGEERNKKYIGARTLDAGDIIQTLAGWTVIGEGKSPIPRRLPLLGPKRDFRDKMNETSKGAHAMDQALGELSLTCDPKNAGRALYLVTAPPKEMHMEIIKELGDNLSTVAPDALIRSGDYPRQKGSLYVTIILSELSSVRKITNYFTKAIDLISVIKAKRGVEYSHRKLEETFADIPVLL
ncbi:MAG: cell division protein FtsZ [Chloroflexi bacterium CG07_land_8_20_14_0_80_45_17]|nr:MAG: cell division protein FtsZ [Chloroflexi bacterium CG23_combo_of_CG06-09_8_20_14_all_45_10]PIU56341.1 MAG: cell division protein FtsZ [Chloroflexi bacterium CG07_land_8_20_14_0_80_45_17]